MMKQHKKGLFLWLLIVAALLAASLLAGPPGEKAESIQTTMRDAVLHDANQINLIGWKAVNPGLISAFAVTAILLVAAALIRIFAIPRFRYVPGKFQLALEEAVGMFDRMAKTSSPSSTVFSAPIFLPQALTFSLVRCLNCSGFRRLPQ